MGVAADEGTSSGGNRGATCPGRVMRLDTLRTDAVVEDG